MMIMKHNATEEDIKRIVKEIRHYGLKADVSRGEFRTVIGLVGAAIYYAVTNKAAAPPAPRVITHVITHVVTRPGKPVLTGTEIVVLVIALNRRAR